MAACPSCGEANPARARFCLACGKPLAEGAPTPREMRKTVTIVFCDVIGSTPLGDQLDAESYRRVISRYFVEMSSVLERHGGTVEKFIGDAVMAVFGIPTVHEDDALRAVRAAVEMREALGRLNEQLRDEFGVEVGVRTGVNTGEVIAGDPTEGQAFATGEAVAVAQRLEAAASSGEILIGEPTYRLVRDAVLVEPLDALDLKGKADATPAWRLLAVVAGAPAFARRLDSPLVGRDRELLLLEQAFHRAADEHACHLFTLLGAAGVGKSRLVNEFVASLGEDATVLIGRCVPYGEGVTYWPLRDLVRQAARLPRGLGADESRERLRALVDGDPDADRIAAAVAAATGIDEGDPPNEETFWAVRKLLEAMAHARPVVAVFDDVQWAEPTFLDLIDHLADWTRGSPVFVVCLARPDLLDERPSWGGGKLNATSILLEPLREAEVAVLLANLLGDAPRDIPPGLLHAAEGNPLFVEEMVAVLIDEGRVIRDDGDWQADGDPAAVEAPPTIQALLAARLDQLRADERDMLQRAAVIGKVFSREALAALSLDEALLDDVLSGLVRKDLLRPDRASTEPAFRFRHILIRDAAYQSLAKEARAEQHERFAQWIERARRDHLREYEEILGYHFEQAHRYRAELAPADAHTRQLATRAAGLLTSAGRRAFARGDLHASAGLLTRATLLLRDDDLARLELAPELGSALLETGELLRADGVLAHAIDAARASGDKQLELRALLEHSVVRVRLDPDTGMDEVAEVAREAIAHFEEIGDDRALARAWLRLSDVHWMASRWGDRAAALERALVHAKRAGDRRQETWILGSLMLSLVWGSTPVPEAIRRCEDILREARTDRVFEARATVTLAELYAQVGRLDEARSLYERSTGVLEERGLKLMLGLDTFAGATIELLAGDAAAAESLLREGCAILELMGEKASLATHLARLSEALYQQDRLDEAEREADLSEAASSPEDVHTHVVLRGARAKVLARRGATQEAVALARDAYALADRTDSLNLQGDAAANLAEVLRIAGDDDEAERWMAQAVRLYDAKGNIVQRDRLTAAERADSVAAIPSRERREES